MNLAQFTIEKNRITYMVLATIVLMGVILYQQLPRDSMPPMTIRIANIITNFPGAGPERVEELVTDKIEKVAQELPELKELSSTSRTGLSVIAVELKDDVPPAELQSVWDRLRRKLNAITDLPEGVRPFLDDDGIGDVYGIVVGLTSDGYSYAELKEYADDIRDDLIKLDDAAKVELGGIQAERVYVEFDDTRLKEYGLSANMLINFISSTNILSSGGEVNVFNKRLVLEPTGNFNSVQDIAAMLIPIGDEGRVVNLGDITNIVRGYDTPATQKVRVNGRDAISLHISLKDDANIINLGQEVNRVMGEWDKRLPVGIEASLLSTMDAYIEFKVNDFMVNLGQSITIVLLVMLVFLGLRTGFVIASLIPIVVIMTFMVMGISNIGINQVSLASLIMALGMMVDNGIVVAETIIVKLDDGVPKKQAAVEACSELFTPLLISTLTTSVAFLSFYLAESVMGDVVGPIFLVISIALLSSWFLSLTVIILFAYLFIKVKPAGSKPSPVDRAINWAKGHYRNLIVVALKHKVVVLLAIVAAFIGAMMGFSKIAFVFMPDSDRNMITVDINLPLGTKIERTEEVAELIDAHIFEALQVNDTRQEGITNWSSFIGKGPDSYDQGYTQDEANSSYAHILINTSSKAVNKDMIAKLDAYCYATFPDADIKVSSLAVGPGSVPVEVEISGDDPDVLAAIAEKAKLKLFNTPGTKNVQDDWGPKSKKFVIAVDQNNARNAGVTSQDIATSLQTVLDGFEAGEYREDDESIPIVMRSNDNEEQSFESIQALNVYAQSSGLSVPLLQVASVQAEWQYAKIKRLDIDRTITVSSELKEGGNANAITALMAAYLAEESKSWPMGYTYQFAGDAKDTEENMGAVFAYIPLSGFLILLLLIIQFNSFRKMLMVTCTIPLAVIGVVIGLFLFGETFGFMPFLGVISLAGIIINNAIVLIDRMEMEQNVYRRTEKDAVIVACLQRFRPILLATFTTVLGLIPLYISGGEMWEGMAVVIMIGLLFGTIITLFFIPAFYSLLYKLSYKGYALGNATENALQT